MYKNFGKRFTDLLIAAAGLIILSPLFLFIFLLIGIADGQPPLFYQRRPGLYGKIFTLVKFKTMKDGQRENNQIIPDHLRITRLGKILRNTSLDELPQLWNVLTGSMSLVGPRPLLTEYLPLYTEQQSKRHAVRPGITGWAQVHGRNDIGWAEKFDLDLWYVHNVSFSVDMRILYLTLKNEILASRIRSPENQITEKFKG